MNFFREKDRKTPIYIKRKETVSNRRFFVRFQRQKYPLYGEYSGYFTGHLSGYLLQNLARAAGFFEHPDEIIHILENVRQNKEC